MAINIASKHHSRTSSSVLLTCLFQSPSLSDEVPVLFSRVPMPETSILSVSAVHRPFYISIFISTRTTQHTTFSLLTCLASLEKLDYTIRVGSTPTFSYFDLYLYSAYAAHYV